MNRPLAISTIVLVLLVGLGFGGRTYATHAMSSHALSPKPLGAATPAVAELPYARVTVPSGDRTIVGWWVRASGDSAHPAAAPAVLLLHGNHASISDLIPVQQFLYRHGISSFVFDYSGFGASGGDPSLTNAVQDAAAVTKVFADSAGRRTRKTAFGTALGATVLLQAIDSVQPYVDGVVIEGVAASVKESAVRAGRIPGLIAPLVADVGDNVAAAKRVNVPLLAVHSYADGRVPFTDAERVVAAIPAQYSLVKHWRKGHSAILSSGRTCDWAPILAFIRTGALPAAHIDTTDVCVVEQLAQRARRDSLAATSRIQQAGHPTGRTTATKGGATKSPSTSTKTTATATGPAATRPVPPRPVSPIPATKGAPAPTGATGATGPATKTYTPKPTTPRPAPNRTAPAPTTRKRP